MKTKFLLLPECFDEKKYPKSKISIIVVFHGSDEEAARNVPPNNTIMVRGLAQHITETNISDDIQSCGLTAKDIRLIRKKETGTQKA